jgi:uncharacterized protein (DUF4415 family)
MLKTPSKAKRPSIKMPTVEEDRKIVASAKLDPDAKPLTKAQLVQMVPMKALRGRPKLENKKVLLSVRYSPNVVDYFKSTGEGWQSRMDRVLSDYVTRRAR